MNHRERFEKETGECPIVSITLECSDGSLFAPQSIEVPAIEYMKFLEHENQKLKQQLTWRSVEDELPEEDILVNVRLFYDNREKEVIKFGLVKNKKLYIWGRLWDEVEHYHIPANHQHVTHWLPIPTP